MAPRKQPSSLFSICIKSSVSLINSACLAIKSRVPGTNAEWESDAYSFKCFLISTLPARLFDVLCSERTCCPFNGDATLQLYLLTHHNLKVFRKCDLDNSIPHHIWIGLISTLRFLIVLDLKFICTDEILQIISENCHLLEEINIVSRVDIRRSLFNASVLIRNVSDKGLYSLANLTNLRILAMDPPRNERAHRAGRCITQTGIIMLIKQLRYLEELRIESCDIGSTLIGTNVQLGPLTLRKINCHFVCSEGIKKLIKILPLLNDLSITHLSEHDKDAVLEEISRSNVRLNRLSLSFFTYSDSLHQLLTVKGSYLTFFSLWEVDNILTLDAVLSIGKYCPNLNNLCLMTHSKHLEVPRFFKKPNDIFRELKMLTIGNEGFDIEQLLNFFCECTAGSLETLIVKYQSKINIDKTLIKLVDNGSFKNLKCLWLDCTLEVSMNVVKQVIESCENLLRFTVDCGDDNCDIKMYIQVNNLDVVIGSY